MKLLTFRKRGELTTRIGAIGAEEKIVDLTGAYASYLIERRTKPYRACTSSYSYGYVGVCKRWSNLAQSCRNFNSVCRREKG